MKAVTVPIGLTRAQFDFVLGQMQKDERIERVTVLRNWGYFPVLRRGRQCLFGDVENHPRLGNAKNVTTSGLRYISELLGVAVTKNTIYILRNKLQEDFE